MPRDLLKQIESEVIPHADDGEHEARRAADSFEWRGDARPWIFQDFWEADLRDYTHRFTWCCHALAWGIEQYDKSKEAVHA